MNLLNSFQIKPIDPKKNEKEDEERRGYNQSYRELIPASDPASLPTQQKLHLLAGFSKAIVINGELEDDKKYDDEEGKCCLVKKGAKSGF